jgi:cysteine protease avirulence protein AvrRpt2
MPDQAVNNNTTIQLNVPYVTQLAIGGADSNNAWDDPMGCWYACICMLGYFFEPGPRQGLPELFTMTHKTHNRHQRLIETNDYQLLMAREGLEVIALSDQACSYTVQQIRQLLAISGSIMFCWNKFKPQHARPYGHTCVLIGCNGDNLQYLDPESTQSLGENQSMTVEYFNQQRLFKPGVYGLARKATSLVKCAL